MTQRNERYYVNRPPGSQGDPSDLAYDTLMACEYTTRDTPHGIVLDVFAWLGGVKKRVASYPPGGWQCVQRAGSYK